MMVLQALYFFLPAYAAHATPVVVRFVIAKLFARHTTASWSVIVGIIVAVMTALIQRGLQFVPFFNKLSLLEYTISSALVLGVTFGVGVMLADLLIMIYKRRKGIIASIPVLEQVVYVVGGVLAIYLVSPVAQMVSNVTFYHLILILMFTPLIHAVLSIVGYMTRLKTLSA